MRTKCMKILLLALLSVIFMAALPMAVSAADMEITVIVDGTELEFDVPPAVVNQRTMVPMRMIFEFLGATVEWIPQESGIRATTETMDLYMQLGNPEMTINGTVYPMDVAPHAINGRTLVPLRAVMEAFSADVAWDQKTSSVIIETPSGKYAEALDHSYEDVFDAHHLRTTFGNVEYFDLEIVGNKLKVTCMTTDPNMKSFGIRINEGSLVGIKRVTPGVVCESTVDLNKLNTLDRALVEVYTMDWDETVHWSYINRCLYVEKDGASYRFVLSPIFEHNQKVLSDWIDPQTYLNSNLPQSIVAQSNAICAGITDDYQKLLAIHDWVADNIYYDFDAYYNANKQVSIDVEELLKQPRSVCEGYAELFLMLVQAQGIPCRQIEGYALSLSDAGCWNETNVKETKCNHSWNQAYVNHRWVNVDTTWDSANIYENGTYLYSGIDNHLYFDTTNLFLSYNHKIISIQ